MTTVALPFDERWKEIPALTLGTTQIKAFTDTAAAIANAVDSNIIRVVSDVACHIAFGSAPTATTSSAYLPAGVVEYFKAVDGTTKVSAIRAGSDDGTINVTAMA